VLSSPITWASQLALETQNSEATLHNTTKPDSKKDDDEDVIHVPQQPDNVTISETNDVTELTKSIEDGATNGTFLTVSSVPIMGRSSRFTPPYLPSTYDILKDLVIEKN